MTIVRNKTILLIVEYFRLQEVLTTVAHRDEHEGDHNMVCANGAAFNFKYISSNFGRTIIKSPTLTRILVQRSLTLMTTSRALSGNRKT